MAKSSVSPINQRMVYTGIASLRIPGLHVQLGVEAWESNEATQASWLAICVGMLHLNQWMKVITVCIRTSTAGTLASQC